MAKALTLSMAPLQGFADHIYRPLHAEIYGSVDVYHAPFARFEKGTIRRQDALRLEASLNDGTTLIPQIIFNSVDEFRELAKAVKSIGYKRINLNLGCPHPMQTGKGRGAAMIGRADVMEEVSSLINEDAGTDYSIKMRMGVKEPDQWKGILPTLNRTRLTHITVHPRTARQMYGGDIHHEMFEQILAESAHPVIYNGDILTVEDIDNISSRYPDVEGIMIGRGLLGRPSLAREWRSGKLLERDERLSLLLKFHDRLFDKYEQTLCGDAQILQKIKPFWEYLADEIGNRSAKALRKATTVARYRTVVASIT